ncbi:MAG: hypothetical protein AB8B73_07235 [Ekhidna sp.]
MKKINNKNLYLFLIPLCSLFISCDNNEDDLTAIDGQADIIGTWTISDVFYEFLIDGTDFIEWLEANLELSPTEVQELEDTYINLIDGFKGKITFNKDNTFSSNLTDENNDTGSWTLINSNLTLRSDTAENEEGGVYKVISLTSSNLILEVVETGISDFGEDGTNETSTTTLRLSFSK